MAQVSAAGQVEGLAAAAAAALAGADGPTTVVVKAPPVKGWRTSEFWITVGVVVANHLLRLVQGTPGVAGVIAGAAIDALASTGYAVSRGMAKR